VSSPACSVEWCPRASTWLGCACFGACKFPGVWPMRDLHPVPLAGYLPGDQLACRTVIHQPVSEPARILQTVCPPSQIVQHVARLGPRQLCVC
jgi:hypothetical protein